MTPSAPHPGNGPHATDVPLLGAKGYSHPHDIGLPLEHLYHAAGLTDSARVPSAVVPDLLAG